MKNVIWIFLFSLLVSCLQTDEDQSGEVFSGHKESVNLLTLVNPASSAYYREGDTFYVVLSFPGAMVVTGTPQLTVDIGGSSRTLNFYDQGIDSDELWFEYTVQAGDLDTDGIGITPSIDLNGGTIKYQSTFDVNTLFSGTSLPNILVDSVVPSISGITLPSDNLYEYGDTLILTVNYDQDVYVEGTPRIGFTLGAATEYFNYSSGSGTSTLTFNYTVGDTDLDMDGIAIGNSIENNGGSIKDIAANVAASSITPGATPGILIDGDSPKILTTGQPADGLYNETQNLDFSISFSENVIVTGTPRIIIDVGGTSRFATYYPAGSSPSVLIFRYLVLTGDNDADGITLTSPLDLNGGTIRDATSRDALLTYTAPDTSGIIIDGEVPNVVSVAKPSDGYYKETDTLNITLVFNETVTVTGTPRVPIDIGGTTVYADYQSGSGSSSLLFRYTISAGVNDSDGITLISPFELSGGSIKDWVDRDAQLTYTIPDTSGVYIDTSVPLEPSLVSWSPAESGNFSNPQLNLSTSANDRVGVYSDSLCSTEILNGNADGSGNISFNLTGLSLGTTSVWAKASDNAANESACSASSFDFFRYQVPSGMAVFHATETVFSTDLNQVGSPRFFKWDSLARLDSTYYQYSSSTNPERIFVTQAGNYKLSLNLPLSLVAAVQGTSIQASVLVNGALLEEATAESSYISNLNNHTESSTSMTILLQDLNPNDYIEVQVQGVTVAGAVNVNGVASVHLDYIGADPIFYAKSTQTVGGANLNTGNDALEWLEEKKSAEFIHSDAVSSQIIRVNQAGSYFVYVNVPVESATAYSSIRLRVRVNGVSLPGGLASQGFIRGASGHNRSSVHWVGILDNLLISDQITIHTEQEGAAGNISVPLGKTASILIHQVDTSSQSIALRGRDVAGGTNWNQIAASSVKWDNQDLNDITFYTHDPLAANNDEITILSDGDYLVLFNSSFFSATTNINSKVQVYLNGLPVDGALVGSNYVSAVAGHNESSSASSFYLRGLKNGDVLTVRSSIEANTGTQSTITDAKLFIINYPY